MPETVDRTQPKFRYAGEARGFPSIGLYLNEGVPLYDIKENKQIFIFVKGESDYAIDATFGL